MSTLTGTTIGPLSEISANVARIPLALVPEAKDSIDDKVDSDAFGHWKTMLSPVAEESPSPQEGSPRKPKRNEENAVLHHSPRSRETPCHTSPLKILSRPLSPGSLKMQNFLRRLERKGLSHD